MNTDDTCDQRESRVFLAEATMADLSRPVTTCHMLPFWPEAPPAAPWRPWACCDLSFFSFLHPFLHLSAVLGRTESVAAWKLTETESSDLTDCDVSCKSDTADGAFPVFPRAFGCRAKV